MLSWQAAVEEGIVIGGGCTLLKLAQKVDDIKASLTVDEQRIGAEIVRRALGSPLKLIANNAGINGAVVMQKVGACDNSKRVTAPQFDFLPSNFLLLMKTELKCLAGTAPAGLSGEWAYWIMHDKRI